MMKRSVLSLAVATAITISGTASAGQAEEMERTLQALQAQVAAMQAEIARMKAEQEKQAVQVEEVAKSSASPLDKITFSGGIEFEIAEGGAGSLGEVVLETTVQATESTTGYIKLKSASGGASPTVDEASITHDFGVASVSATSGGHPFGDFSTNMISDPFTKTIGDTGGDTGKLIVEVPVNDNLTLTAGLDDNIESIAAIATIGDFGLTVGHISDVEVDATKSANHIAASYAIGDFSLFAESVDSDGSADATNVEAAYSFAIAGRDATVAVGHQERKVTSAEEWNMFSATVNLDEGLDVIAEHKDSDNNANDAWSAKIAYGF